MKYYAAMFYALNLGVGVAQMLTVKPDPVIVLLCGTGVVSSAVLFAVSL